MTSVRGGGSIPPSRSMEVTRKNGRPYPRAGGSMSDEEVWSVFGDLIKEAEEAFKEDVDYLARMVEAGRALKRR